MEIIRFQKIYPHNLIQDGLVSGGRFSVWRDIWRSVVLGSISNSLDIIRAILHVHAIPNYSSAFGREWGGGILPSICSSAFGREWRRAVVVPTFSTDTHNSVKVSLLGPQCTVLVQFSCISDIGVGHYPLFSFWPGVETGNDR